MTVYVLEPRDLSEDGPWVPWYDACFKMVVVAESEAMARFTAADNCEREGNTAWRDEDLSTCVPIDEYDSDDGLICQDVRWA